MNARRDLYAALMVGGPHSPDRSEKASNLIDAFAAEARVQPAEPREAPAHGKLWSLLDWSFWGAGMGDVFREPLADTMLAAVPTETIAQAEQIMAEFLERRKIEKTGVTIYQEQRDELEQARARIAELEAFAYGCDAEGCVLPHSSWCEEAKKTAAENNGCTCSQPFTGRPQPHAMHCWTVNPPRSEVEEMRKQTAELRAELAKYVGAEPTIAEELAYLSRCLHAVHDLCDKAEQQAKRWEHPLPVPAWVEQVRKAADGLEPASTRAALPWAHAMDDYDLGMFLDDLVSAALGRCRSEPDIPHRQVLADIEKACTDWRTPGQGSRSDEPGAGEGR